MAHCPCSGVGPVRAKVIEVISGFVERDDWKDGLDGLFYSELKELLQKRMGNLSFLKTPLYLYLFGDLPDVP